MANLTTGAALAEIGALFGEGTVAGQTDGQLLDRFLSRRDPMAFESLVQRHGPMVLAVSRGTLRDREDTEDAFQATFLVLIRKAGSIRGRDSIGPWLHRVAHRVAVRANVESRRRREQERRAGEVREADSDRGPRDELRAALHEEIERLPERLRRPLVLCHLEERTHSQAAAELQMGEATVRRRLAGARDLLRSRLGRRGIAPAALALAGDSARAAVPASWTSVAIRAAMAATFPGGIITPAASALSRRVARTIVASRLRRAVAWAAAGFVACSAWGIVTSAARQLDDRPEAAPRPATAPVAAGAGREEGKVEVRGRVVDEKERPVAGARVLVTVPSEDGGGGAATNAVVEATSGPDGRFRIEIPHARLDAPSAEPGWREPEVVATADGYGLAWVSLAKARKDEPVLRLVADVPLSGRVLDLEGRPVAGARIAVSRVATVKGGDLTPYINTIRDGTEDGNGRLLERHWSGPFPGRAGSVSADADGRFRLSGFGRERLVEMTAEAPAIEHVTFMAMTREAAAVGGGGEKSLGGGNGRVHGATFDLLVPPGRSITGVVRDKATKRPISGMFVGKARQYTDAQGRFVATGFAKGKSYELFVTPRLGQPYFVTCTNIPDTPGLTPIEADVECVRGIPYRLKLTDRATGKPVPAEVSYHPIYPNEHTREVPGFTPFDGTGSYSSAHCEPDGTYIGGVLPGPGAICIRKAGRGYRPACVDPQAFFAGNPGGKMDAKGDGDRIYGDRQFILAAQGPPYLGAPMPQSQFQAIVLTNAPEGSGPLSFDVALDRDPGHTGTVLGPDGRPLAGCVVDGLNERGEAVPLKTAEFDVTDLNPSRTRRLTFTHEAKRLSGFLLVRGDEPQPYAARLKPWATITGRLVDDEGKPRPGVRLMAKDWQGTLDNPAYAILPGGRKTDAEGRFRYEGLVAGLIYDAVLVDVKDDKGFGIVFDDATLGPGELRDLGDVRAKPRR